MTSAPARADEQVILFVHGADEWYGSDYVLYEIVRALRSTEFTPVVLLPDDVTSELEPSLRLSGRLAALGAEVHTLPLTVLRRRYMTPGGALTLFARRNRVARDARRRVAGRKVVLVHSHTATVLSGADIARALRVPHLWHVSEIVQRPALVRRLLARTVARSAQRIAAVSAAVRDHLAETHPAALRYTEVVHNGIDVTRYVAADGSALRARLSPDGAPIVGMIGRVGTWKGQELLMDAAREVARERPGTRFVFVGGVLDGREQDLVALRHRADALGLGDCVAIEGYAPNTAEYLAAMSVFVLPSLRPDPLPTTVLEAMASGIPVVAVRHGGAAEMVVDGETGLLTPPGDAAALARAIVTLLDEPDTRERMGAAGRERVRRHFSPEAFSAAYLGAYRSLVRDARRRR